jgi:hypothetical protein
MRSRLSFQPRFGFCQIKQRACQVTLARAFPARRQGACPTHHLKGGVAVGKGTTEEHQITHGSTPALKATSSRIVSEYPLKAGLAQGSAARSSTNCRGTKRSVETFPRERTWENQGAACSTGP